MTLELQDFELDLARPLTTARGTLDRRTGTLVRLRTDATTGIGEAAPLPGWTESLADCRRALTALQDGADVSGDQLPAARHGVTLAIRDALARYRDRPVAATLAPHPVDTVPVNATIGDSPQTETAVAAEQAVADGFRTLKIKVGVRPLDADLDRLHAVREVVGPDVRVRADANGAWDRATARRAVDELAWLEYVEQPLPADDLAGHAALRKRDGAPIALDEAVTVHDPRTILAADATDVIVIKPMVLGGLERGLALARAATRRDVTPIVTTTVDAAVARTGAVHLAAALPTAGTRAQGLATVDRLTTDLVRDPVPVTDGHIRVPSETGLAGDAFANLV